MREFAKDLMRHGTVLSRKDYVTPSGWVTIREIEYKDQKFVLRMQNGKVISVEGKQ